MAVKPIWLEECRIDPFHHRHSDRWFLNVLDFFYSALVVAEASELTVQMTLDLMERVWTQPITPGTVIRSDGTDGDNKSASVIFVSFPYLATGPLKLLELGKTQAMKTLNRMFHQREFAEELDLNQALPKYGEPCTSHILHVHQTWILMFDSETLFTCSPAGAAQLWTQPSNSKRKRPFCMIRVTDPFSLVHFLPADECQSWFELKENLARHCLKDTNYLLDRHCDIMAQGMPMTGSAWPLLLSESKTPIINLTVVFKIGLLERPHGAKAREDEEFDAKNPHPDKKNGRRNRRKSKKADTYSFQSRASRRSGSASTQGRASAKTRKPTHQDEREGMDQASRIRTVSKESLLDMKSLGSEDISSRRLSNEDATTPGILRRRTDSESVPSRRASPEYVFFFFFFFG